MPSTILYPRTALALGAAVLLAASALWAAPGDGGPPEAEEPPKTIAFSSHVGEVQFPHLLHIDELEIACEECHHPAVAPVLRTPHPGYFRECSSPCSTCHVGEAGASITFRCRSCHPAPSTPGCEDLSAKVAIHHACAGCHEIGSGAAASQSCASCHSGPKSPW